MELEQELEKLKAERTQHRTKVTYAAKRLQSAISRKSDESCFVNFMLDLEKCLSDFDICNDDYAELVTSDEKYAGYATVNSLDLNQYKAAVETTYKGAKESFVQTKQSGLQEQNFSKPVQVKVKLSNQV